MLFMKNNTGIYLLVQVLTNELRFGMWLLENVILPWSIIRTRSELSLILYIIFSWH